VALAFSVSLAVPAEARAARPCVRVEAQSYWVEQCSPLIFTGIECLDPSYDENGLHVLVHACFPVEV